MQSSHTTITLAGEQTPLLAQDQLHEGALVTGVAASHVWEIMRRDTTHIEMRKAPTTQRYACIPELPGRMLSPHRFSVVGRGQVCTVCQMRRQEIKDLLPIKTGKARVCVITPRSSSMLLVPQPSTVYGALLGTELKLYHLNNGMWNEPLPIYPELLKIWEIPEALRSLDFPSSGGGGLAPLDTLDIT